MRRRSRDAGVRRTVHQVSSWFLSYPDADLVKRLPLLMSAVEELPPSAGDATRAGLVELGEHLSGTPLPDLQRGYVELFDLSRHRAMHLSYWTDGDTRRRGEVLGRFKSAYRASGFLVQTGGELPDHLPMVLEFAAIADPVAGAALLQEYRASIELIRLELLERGSPYAGALTAVCATLPGESPADRAAARALAGPPPAESVGLEPYDPRLLPVLT
ncbi:nitrate reductase molybdenum cofactor assembly chaperone [Aeromicrobium chenweiae]|uniref:Nitrate reductase molybdenum cofactor assembly chaperone n=1 Tax=Aeromicrobium chenweiae TaxID=2079793 RepID=A0A2S0WPF2_9ACTN|nr:nitrate reductase molybdenum cofactor assembly chaperone [Aeromicrobium chenweiae]AWB93124.1 nitrate reductase molybdenum cofactor assembly chaperone [Aeromicrobium chenweiae]TGN34112.1 nitrate reductase molybdenum cofactor assembly chaperone [Aeromicrobium chenweiae]